MSPLRANKQFQVVHSVCELPVIHFAPESGVRSSVIGGVHVFASRGRSLSTYTRQAQRQERHLLTCWGQKHASAHVHEKLFVNGVNAQKLPVRRRSGLQDPITRWACRSSSGGAPRPGPRFITCVNIRAPWCRVAPTPSALLHGSTSETRRHLAWDTHQAAVLR